MTLLRWFARSAAVSNDFSSFRSGRLSSTIRLSVNSARRARACHGSVICQRLIPQRPSTEPDISKTNNVLLDNSQISIPLHNGPCGFTVTGLVTLVAKLRKVRAMTKARSNSPSERQYSARASWLWTCHSTASTVTVLQVLYLQREKTRFALRYTQSSSSLSRLSVKSHHPFHQLRLHALHRRGLLHSRYLSSYRKKNKSRLKEKHVPCSCRAIFAARSSALTAPNIISISSRERPFVSGIILCNDDN